MGLDRGAGSGTTRGALRRHRRRAAVGHRGPQGLAGGAAATGVARRIRVGAALPVHVGCIDARRPRRSSVVDSSAAVAAVDLSGGAGDVHPRQPEIGRELVVARPAAYGGPPDGSRSAATTQRRAMGLGTCPPVHDTAVPDADPQRGNRRCAGPPPTRSRWRTVLACTRLRGRGRIPRGNPGHAVRPASVVSPVRAAEVKQPTHASTLVLGADMQQLWQRYPPRTPPSRWPATEGDRDQVLARLLAPPFTVDAPDAQERRRRGLVGVVDWLAGHPGATWQQRWLASGAEALGNADWWRPWLGRLQSGSQRRGQSVTVTSNLRVCLLLLVCAEVIRPGVSWLLTPRTPQSLVTELARTRDPDGFAEFAALCDASPTGRTMTMGAMRRVATIVAIKGGNVHDITVGDCLELTLTLDGDTRRKNKGLGFYQLLHQMGVFGPHAPSTLRAFATQGQLSPAQMLAPYGIQCAPIRELILAYLHERHPMLDHTTLRSLAFTLGRLFWRDLEIHHAGINSLNLTPEVAAAWKQRVLTRTIRTTGPDGQTVEERRPRADGRSQLTQVRAFYLDLAQWAMEEPTRWGPWAAPCPVRREDLVRTKELRRRKSRVDQRTRERLPVLPALLARVQDERVASAARLATAHATTPGDTFTDAGRLHRRAAINSGPAARVWVEDPDTGTRQDLTGQEDRAFWTWAAVETLQHTGDSHRGTDRTQPPQPDPVHPADQPGTHPAAADRTVQDRHRTSTGHQPRTCRCPGRRHPPHPRLHRSGALRDFLRPTRTPMEPTPAAAVPTPLRAGNPVDPRRHPPRLDLRRPGRQRDHRRHRQAAAVHPARFSALVHHRRRATRHATTHRSARGWAPGHQHHHGLQSRPSRRSHQRPPGLHRTAARAATRRRVPRAHRRRMARIPRTLRPPQGCSWHLRTLLLHPMYSRTFMLTLPTPAARSRQPHQNAGDP